MRHLETWILLILISLGISSCLPTRNVRKGEYLTVKKIKNYKIEGEKLKDIQFANRDFLKTNQTIFYLRLKLKMYDIGTLFKDSSRLNRFFTKNIGEPPVLYDSLLHQRSAKNIENYLHSLGYFEARVNPVVTHKKLFRKTIFTGYEIFPGNPFYISKFNLDIKERELKTFIQADLSYSKIKEGEIFNVDVLKSEMERISNTLQNTGYYYFSSEQIRFVADTLRQDSNNRKSIELTLFVNNVKIRSKVKKDSLIELPNKRFKFQNIYINLLDNENTTQQRIDTVSISFQVNKKQNLVYHFIHSGEMKINPKAIIRAIYLKPGAYYKKVDVLETHKSLSSLNIFSLINIVIKDVSGDTTKTGLLDVILNLSQSQNYRFNTASEVKNTGGILGVEQNIGIDRNNIFRNAEIFSLSVRAAAEVQSVVNVETNKNDWFFNTYETGLRMSLDFPKFIVPFQDILAPRYIKPRTKILAGYNFQQRPDFTRNILNVSFGYHSKPNSRVTRLFNLIEISSVYIDPSEEFQREIDLYKDAKIKYAYQDHLVINSRYSRTYKESDNNKSRPYRFWYYNIELGGGLSNIVSSGLKLPTDSLNQYLIAGVPFAKYILAESDFRYYHPIRKKINNVFRVYAGIGIPYAGSKGIPFEKSFYIGGANSLRAWKLGKLGPGSYYDSEDAFEKSGDIKIEMNYEFRFPISGSFEGAVFTDLGNIWLLSKSVEQPGAEFNISNFYQQFAFDFGYGLRYNLDFIVVRFDVGHPIYQPYLASGKRWSSFNSNDKLISGFNLAINYPF